MADNTILKILNDAPGKAFTINKLSIKAPILSSHNHLVIPRTGNFHIDKNSFRTNIINPVDYGFLSGIGSKFYAVGKTPEEFIKMIENMGIPDADIRKRTDSIIIEIYDYRYMFFTHIYQSIEDLFNSMEHYTQMVVWDGKNIWTNEKAKLSIESGIIVVNPLLRRSLEFERYIESSRQFSVVFPNRKSIPRSNPYYTIIDGDFFHNYTESFDYPWYQTDADFWPGRPEVIEKILSTINDNEDRKIFKEVMIDPQDMEFKEPEKLEYVYANFPDYYINTLKNLYRARIKYYESRSDTSRIDEKISAMYKLRKKYMRDSIM
jgi:hypothetical protein